MKNLRLLSAIVLCVPAASLAADVLTPSPAAPAPAVIDQHAAPVELRSLRAIQNARDEAVKSQQAADEAAGKIPNKELQSQVQSASSACLQRLQRI